MPETPSRSSRSHCDGEDCSGPDRPVGARQISGGSSSRSSYISSTVSRIVLQVSGSPTAADTRSQEFPTPSTLSIAPQHASIRAHSFDRHAPRARFAHPSTETAAIVSSRLLIPISDHCGLARGPTSRASRRQLSLHASRYPGSVRGTKSRISGSTRSMNTSTKSESSFPESLSARRISTAFSME